LGTFGAPAEDTAPSTTHWHPQFASHGEIVTGTPDALHEQLRAEHGAILTGPVLSVLWFDVEFVEDLTALEDPVWHALMFRL